MRILGADPRRQYESHRVAIDAAVQRVLASGWYILGQEVAAFEAEFAAYIGVPHAVGVGNGTDALYLALAAAEVGSGHEVITVAHTAVATVAAIEQTGACPVLVDIDRETYTLDPAQLEAAITPRTRAIVVVHLYGHSAEINAIQTIAAEHDLLLIEDCAQAHGARVGTRRLGSIGHAGCFSFYPTKNLGALGDGGMVVTRDARLADRLRGLRQYGWAQRRYVSEAAGGNSRLDEIQAAVLRVKLPHLDADNARRLAIASRYSAELHPIIITPTICPEATHVFHQYVIRTAHRDALRDHLHAHGIGALIHYPLPVHCQPAYRHLSRPLPVTEQAAREILSLPIYPELADDEVDAIIDCTNAFFEA